MCTQCHAEFKDTASLQRHTRHPMNSEGSQCASCHMPPTMNALRAPARTHRVDDISNARMTEQFGQQQSPNACLICHDDKSVARSTVGDRMECSQRSFSDFHAKKPLTAPFTAVEEKKLALDVSAEFCDGVEHGEHVLHGRFLEDIVVAGAGHVPAACFHDIEDFARFFPDGLARSVDQYVVRIYCPIEQDFVAKRALQSGQVHSLAGRLDGVQTIQSSLNHLRNQRGVSTATVHHYFQPVGVP